MLNDRRYKWTKVLAGLACLFLLTYVLARHNFSRRIAPVTISVVAPSGGSDIQAPIVKQIVKRTGKLALQQCFRVNGPDPLVWKELKPGEFFLVFKGVRSDHEREWELSGVNPELIASSVVSIPEVACTDNLKKIYFPIGSYLMQQLDAKQYEPDFHGTGWLVQLINPLSNEHVPWAEITRDYTQKTATLKYRFVSPPGFPNRIGYFPVPDTFAEKVYATAKIGPGTGSHLPPFWPTVRRLRIPVVLTVGLKNAGALISAGYPAVGLKAICSGMRLKDRNGNPAPPALNDDLTPVVYHGADVYLAFGEKKGPDTDGTLGSALYYLGTVLTGAGAHPKIVTLPGPELTIGEFIHSRGAAALEPLLSSAVSLGTWKLQHQDKSQVSPAELAQSAACN